MLFQANVIWEELTVFNVGTYPARCDMWVETERKARHT